MRTKLRIALAQIASKMGDVEGNFKKVFEFIGKGVEEEADVVVFPELATCGYLSQGIFLEAAERETPYLVKLLEKTRNVHVVLGIVEETEAGILYNSAIVAGHGRVIEGDGQGQKHRSYRKCYLPTYGMFEEMRWFASGCEVPVFSLDIPDIGKVKAGVLICEDLWQPLPARIAAARGAQFISVISASPKTLDKPRIVDSLLRARAIENVTYIAFANLAGSQDMVNFWGGSKLVSPDGQVIVEAKLNEEDFVVGELDLYSLRKAREVNPMLREEKREIIDDYLHAYEEMRRR